MDIKKINLETLKPKPSTKKNEIQGSEKKTTEKQIKKRVITQTDKWDEINDMSLTTQYIYLKKIQDNDFDNISHIDQKIMNLLKQQIQQKIYGYRGQDIEKNILDLEQFVDFDKVLDLLKKSNFLCYYCREKVHILYENVREPKQWTLDRIDNKHGHNKTNLLIACLTCNLRRRTMHTERYVFTKQLNIIKTDELS